MKVSLEFLDWLTLDPKKDEGKVFKTFYLDKDDVEIFSTAMHIELKRIKSLNVKCYII